MVRLGPLSPRPGDYQSDFLAMSDRCITQNMPVELLRDARGIYGIGITESHDLEALAWSCGIEETYILRPPPPLILRPDCLARRPYGYAALQRIVGGFRHGPFEHTVEEELRQFIHHEALRRAGLPWPRPDHRERWWSNDKAQQARNRGVYHGLRLLSVGVINRLIGELHEAAADPDAIRAARRFTLRYREDIYRACAPSRRALQLVETFPVAALAIYSDRWFFAYASPDHEIKLDEFERLSRQRAQQQQDAAKLVECGARLRDVAAALEIPLALRHVPPGAAHLVGSVVLRHPDLIQWMPRQTPAAKIWLKLVDFAHNRGGHDFGRWIARHVSEIPGRLNGVAHTVTDLADWVCAKEGSGREFVTRSFTPAMGLKAATQASQEWHEAVATNADCRQGYELPPPWYPAEKQGAFEIVPIVTAADLYREGQAMHHCVATYGDRIREGACYVFSVRQSGERKATVSLVRDGARVQIEQVRGPCNSTPTTAIMTALRQWLRTRPAPAIQPRDQQSEGLEQISRAIRAAEDDLEGFPF
jgi:PcfJ-like protein